MQDAKKPEKYGLTQPISDGLAEDPEALAAMREATILYWHDQVAHEGWKIVAEPTIRSDVNLMYGHPIYKGDEPMLDDDGEQIVDHTKEVLLVSGWVVRS